MALREQLNEDIKNAMKAREQDRLATLRLMLSAVKQREVDERVTLDDNLPHQAVEAAFHDANAFGAARDIELIALDEALTRLSEMDPDLVRIVELRYFGGLTVEETAEAVGVSPATVKRQWAVARAWLKRSLMGATPAAQDVRER